MELLSIKGVIIYDIWSLIVSSIFYEEFRSSYKIILNTVKQRTFVSLKNIGFNFENTLSKTLGSAPFDNRISNILILLILDANIR